SVVLKRNAIQNFLYGKYSSSIFLLKFIGQGLEKGGFLFKRIYSFSMYPKTVTNVWSTGSSCHPDPSNYIYLANVLSLFNLAGLHVQVLGFIGAAMSDFYIIAVAAPVFRFCYHPICGS